MAKQTIEAGELIKFDEQMYYFKKGKNVKQIFIGGYLFYIKHANKNPTFQCSSCGTKATIKYENNLPKELIKIEGNHLDPINLNSKGLYCHCAGEKNYLEEKKIEIKIEGVCIETLRKCPYMYLRDIKTQFDLSDDEIKKVENKMKTLAIKMGIPKSVNDLVQQKYHLILANTKSIGIFGRRWGLEVLAKSPIIQMDGTFKCVPNGFSQLYSIHGYLKGVCIHCLFILLPNKKNSDYLSLFNLIESECKKVNSGFSIFSKKVEVVVDFEQAVIKSLKEYKEVNIIGCQFHFSQCILKKINRLGLKDIKKGNSKKLGDFFDGIKCICCIPFLHHCFINSFLIEFILNHMKQCLDPDYYPSFKAFGDYLFKVWFGSKSRYSCRGVYGHSVRTNNPAEAYHAEINKNLHGPPNLHFFLFKLKKLMVEMEEKIFKISNGDEVHYGSDHINDKNNLIICATDNLWKEQLDVISFLDIVSMILKIKSNSEVRKIKDRLFVCGDTKLIESRKKSLRNFGYNYNINYDSNKQEYLEKYRIEDDINDSKIDLVEKTTFEEKELFSKYTNKVDALSQLTENKEEVMVDEDKELEEDNVEEGDNEEEGVDEINKISLEESRISLVHPSQLKRTFNTTDQNSMLKEITKLSDRIDGLSNKIDKITSMMEEYGGKTTKEDN